MWLPPEERDMHLQAPAVDEAELGRLAGMLACLSPAQQRVLVALADGIRGGWMELASWERYWRSCDLADDATLGMAMTWLARRAAGFDHRG
jgi:hypothetical protein